MATKPATTAQPLPPCDCLTDCGDDPRIDRGKARPCQVYVNHIQSKRLHDASADLLAFAQAVARYAGNSGDDYLADKARAVIDKATKGTQP
jgi:hypothetical protein